MTQAYQLINDTKQLKEFCTQLSREPWFALDTEFIRESTYFPKLCLVQIATPTTCMVIDPLKLPDLSPLLNLILDNNIVKILHSARQDLEIFFHLCGEVPQTIFDTQIGAAFLGLSEQISYAALVSDYTGVQLEKSHTRTDWSRRPLSPEQLRYAADDVIYLAKLYPVILQRLKDSGHFDWAIEEHSVLKQAETYITHPEQAWGKVKNRNRLKGYQLALLQLMAAWREKEAIHYNRPRKWILNDEQLLAIVYNPDLSEETLLQIKGLKEKTISKYVSVWKKLGEEANLLGPDMPRQKPFSKLTDEQLDKVDKISRYLKQRAIVENIHPTILATQKEIRRAVRGEDSNILRGWRHELFGDDIRKFLSDEKVS